MLATIYLSEDNPYFAIDDYGALYSKDMSTLYKVPPQNSEYIIPRTVTTIIEYALFGMQHLSALNIPNTVTSIGTRLIMYSKIPLITNEKGINLTQLSFLGYSQIKNFTVPKSVQVLKDSCFWRCYNMLSIDFEEGSELEIIESSAFGYCNFQQIIIPAPCKEIRKSAFNYQQKLKNISLPATIQKLYPDTFLNCQNIQYISLDDQCENYSLIDNVILQSADGLQTIYIVSTITSITITASMKTIGNSVLQGCDNLTTITVDPNNKYFSASNGILYDLKKTKSIAAVGGIVKAVVADSVTMIGPSCFAGCQKMPSITLGSKVVSIEFQAFTNAKKITTITFPATLKYIRGSAFYYATILRTVRFLGDSLETIGTLAFQGTRLSSITFGSNLKLIEHDSFNGIPLTSLTFHPDCPMQKIRYNTSYQTKLTKVSIPRAVKVIEYYAFYNIKSLVTIEFQGPANITEIQRNVFSNANITTLSLLNTLTSLSNLAFFGCTYLETLIFEEGMMLDSLGQSCFRECLNLVRVQLPSSISDLSPTTFIGCTKLQSIDIPSDNANYSSEQGIVYSKSGDRLIICPAGLSSATIKKTILVIGSNAFYGCSLLETITFEPGCRLETMEEGTFGGCTALVRVDLPTSLQVV
ncbi:surface antigen BspA-like [Trichomonas vaginalis G3]|uniref:Surface antigen BspA-like n=1 Tax=Trichomonas vaginalis (strain ATCC PRA-98 / G3) TaxID=412133 RepID=A2F7S7_TRIV3|nr:leucine-rich repeats (6 copies)-containing protein [Trichomonas vaginalis G3]EAX99054.1 surface antigen BspA-like [Trichomonas vaginalis G3]KAI5553788.1 leucine-rich repeats (6 copies)-containing protein [Trichomonas vaginalis G3]|eukprot:XP_001311984.1 surface antigen BspA-like [Trichomonas vaginalis G3]